MCPLGFFFTHSWIPLFLEFFRTPRIDCISQFLPSAADTIIFIAIQYGKITIRICRNNSLNITKIPSFYFFNCETETCFRSRIAVI